ncbi:MAG: histidine kinase [Treponema sp.]|nr:histidine kinase [Treponema sp.]
MNSDNSTVKHHILGDLIPLLFVIVSLSLLVHCLSYSFVLCTRNITLSIFHHVLFGVFFIIQICLIAVLVALLYTYHKTEQLIRFYLNGNDEEILNRIHMPYSKGFYRLLTLQKKKSEQILFEENRRQSQYLALQNQINPHFLYNTLEAIRSEALIGGLHGVADMCETLANYFRYTISKTSSLVTLADEIHNVQDYFKIQQFRFGGRIKLEITVPLDGELRFYRMPKLILQPIVENAVIHGLESKLQGGRIKIDATISEDNFYIKIEDDGQGMSESTLLEINRNLGNPATVKKEKKYGGIAIINVNERLQLLYGAKYGLTYYSLPQIGTTVEICLPRFPNANLLDNG